jgi:succinate dehydrogenase/fumarate reductase-like Fe-S protein
MSHILHPIDSEDRELGRPVTAEIFRFDPSSDPRPRMETYVVPYRRRMSAFTLLREIYERQDPTLAFRNQQCGRGICGNCYFKVEINRGGERLVKGCTVVLQPGDQVSVRPRNIEKVIRDLATSLG